MRDIRGVHAQEFEILRDMDESIKAKKRELDKNISAAEKVVGSAMRLLERIENLKK